MGEEGQFLLRAATIKKFNLRSHNKIKSHECPPNVLEFETYIEHSRLL
jgi:hypothetical protein